MPGSPVKERDHARNKERAGMLRAQLLADQPHEGGEVLHQVDAAVNGIRGGAVIKLKLRGLLRTRGDRRQRRARQ